MRAVQSHALGSINRTQRRGRREQTGRKTRKERREKRKSKKKKKGIGLRESEPKQRKPLGNPRGKGRKRD
jgi:hypothetical protein